MSTSQPQTTTSVYPDRSRRLMFLGIVQVLLGCLCGLMAVGIDLRMVAVSVLWPMAQAPQAQAMTRHMTIQGMVLYLPLAVAFVWLGIGLVRPPLGLDLDGCVVVDMADHGRGLACLVCHACVFHGADDVGIFLTAGEGAARTGDCSARANGFAHRWRVRDLQL